MFGTVEGGVWDSCTVEGGVWVSWDSARCLGQLGQCKVSGSAGTVQGVWDVTDRPARKSSDAVRLAARSAVV